jgi:hypothetical protein
LQPLTNVLEPQGEAVLRQSVDDLVDEVADQRWRDSVAVPVREGRARGRAPRRRCTPIRTRRIPQVESAAFEHPPGH